MKKNDLLTLPILRATPAMMRMAAEDIPKKTTYKYWNGSYTREESKYDLFMRGAVREDILLSPQEYAPGQPNACVYRVHE